MARQDKKERKKPQTAAGLPRVRSMGISIWDPIYAERFHASCEHEFIHVMEGEMVIHVGSRKTRVVSGDTIFLKKGTVHRDEFLRESSFRVFHVLFKWKHYDAVIPADINAKLAAMPSIEKRKIREMAMEMYRLFQSGRFFAREMVNACLYNVLLYGAGIVRAGQERRNNANLAEEKRRAVIDEAKQYINSHFDRPIALADIAEHLKLSEYYVSHIFSLETGFTFSSYLTRLRMEHAAGLLCDLKNNVAEAAYRVGYGDQNYFGKVFRKYFSCTPSQYRSRLLQFRRKAKKGE